MKIGIISRSRILLFRFYLALTRSLMISYLSICLIKVKVRKMVFSERRGSKALKGATWASRLLLLLGKTGCPAHPLLIKRVTRSARNKDSKLLIKSIYQINPMNNFLNNWKPPKYLQASLGTIMLGLNWAKDPQPKEANLTTKKSQSNK